MAQPSTVCINLRTVPPNNGLEPVIPLEPEVPDDGENQGGFEMKNIRNSRNPTLA